MNTENILQAILEETTFLGLKIGISVVVLLIFWILANVTKRAIIKISARLGLDAALALLLARTAKITLIIFGIITALGTLGVNVSALVAGLGLSGFALGFALKDTISNLLAGVLILLYRPFGTGNRIKISGYEGTVVSIDLRYTELEGDGSRILIPNSKLFTNPIVVLK
ncbi:MAG: mechanosensitive ion channel [Deferribacteres bacterium]|nr:mechanosensitive ion channel [Deferribacteres bacterium]